MKEDKVQRLRYIMTVITMVLAFMMICFCIVALQVKTVHLDYYGTNIRVKTLSSNIQGFLLSNNIYVDENTVVYPDITSNIYKNMSISISSKNEIAKIDIDTMLAEYKPVSVKIVEQEELIQYAEEVVENPGMYRGVSRVTKEGANGLKNVKYVIKYSEGQEIARTVLEENVITEPTNKVIEVGTNLNLSTSRSQGVVIPSVDAGFKVYNIALSQDMQQYTYAMCQKYGVQYELLLAVMYVESRYNVNAVGGGNSYGLCQIHYSNTANLRRRIGLTNLLDPYDNIEAGAYMLNLYLNAGRKYSSDMYFIEHYGLNCYNMGEGVYRSNCYTKGILERTYSNKVRSIRDTLITRGGI